MVAPPQKAVAPKDASAIRAEAANTVLENVIVGSSSC